MKKLITLITIILLLSACAKPQEKTEKINTDYKSLTHFRGASNVAYNEQGIYETIPINEQDNLIYYTDYKSKTSTPLCTNAECRHDDETCTAFLKGAAYLFINDDKIFAISSDIKENAVIEKIIKMEFDGSNKEVVHQCEDNEQTEMFKHIVGTQGKIYITTLNFVEGHTDYNCITKIVEINYIDKENRTVIESKNDISLKDVIGDELIYSENFIFENIVKNNAISLSTGKVREISQSMYSRYEKGEYYYIFTSFYNGSSYTQKQKNNSDDSTLEIKDLTSNQSKEFIFNDISSISIVDIFDDVIIIYDNDNMKMQLLNTDTKEIKDLTLLIENETREYNISVSAVMQDELFVVNELDTMEYAYTGKQGENIISEISVYNHAFISKEDFYNNIPNYIEIERLN